MAHSKPHVKCDEAGRKCRWWDPFCHAHAARNFVDAHPRTGWYLFALIALNFALDGVAHLL